jgi:DNA replicative helicase MCM subunit Mcm2 (Cdc46/Mcm family)
MQEIKIQQRYEKITSGRVPKTMMGVIFGKDMINKVRAGDIAAITGIVDITRNPSANENAVAEYYIEILWIEPKSDDFLTKMTQIRRKVKTFIIEEKEDEGSTKTH